LKDDFRGIIQQWFIDTEEEQVNLRRISLTSTGNGRLTGKVEALPMLHSARFKG